MALRRVGASCAPIPLTPQKPFGENQRMKEYRVLSTARFQFNWFEKTQEAGFRELDEKLAKEMNALVKQGFKLAGVVQGFKMFAWGMASPKLIFERDVKKR